jgi:acyl-CoA-binding protein
MSLKSEGGTQAQELVAIEAKINKLENERKELKGKTDEFSQQCYLNLLDEIIELRREKNYKLTASATESAQQGW